MSDEQKKNGGSKQPLDSFCIAFFANVLVNKTVEKQFYYLIKRI